MIGAPPGLFEREAELGAVDAQVRSALGGSGSMIVIEAPPGIGKTALLAAATRRSRPRHLLLRARGSELESDFAFGLVRQCFEGELRRASDEELSRLLAGAARHAEPIFDLGSTDLVLGPGDQLSRALHSLYWVLANLAERQPVFLGLDDLHWSDDASLRFIDFLLPGRLAELPVAIVATARSSEIAGSSEILARVVSKCPPPIKLRPLSSIATQQMIEARLGAVEEDFADAAHDLVAGNPLFLEQLLVELEAQDIAPTRNAIAYLTRYGPPSVSRIVITRLAHLHAAAPRLSQAVAVLGEDVPLELARVLARVDDADARVAADELMRASIFRRDAALSFVHPIVQNAVYTDLSPDERSRLHREAARLLANRAAPPERVAAHLLATSPEGDDSVAARLVDAASTARDRGALDEATSYLRRAVGEAPSEEIRRTVLRDLAGAEFQAGAPEAFEHIRQWRVMASDPAERAAAAQLLATGLTLAGRAEEAMSVLDDERLALDRHHGELSAWLGAWMAALGPVSLEGTSLGAERLAELPHATGDAETDWVIAVARAAYAVLGAEVGASQAASLFEPLLGDLAVLRWAETPVLALTAWPAPAAGQIEQLEGLLEKALRSSASAGSLLGRVRALHWRAYTRLIRGQLGDAAEDARGTLAAAEENGWALGMPAALGFLLDSLVESGEIEDARAELAGREKLVETSLTPSAMLIEARGRLLVAEGAIEAGLADLLEVGRRFEAAGIRNPALSAWRSNAAVTAHRLERVEEARALADQDLRRAASYGLPRPHGIALRVAAHCGNGSEAIDLLRESVAVLAESPARLEHAKSLVELGAALRRARHRVDAREPLSEGMRIAHRLGAGPLAERARQELAATGARPRRLTLTGVDSLTASELRIASMAAEGLSNPEIAQALFVTRRTVETHLTSVYRKLEISSRAELAGALSD